jgi:hypothetical protein
MLNVQRSSYRSTRIVRSRLHVHVSKVSAIEYHSVGDTVQSNSTGEAYCMLPRLFLNEIQKRKIVLLEHRLNRGGQVSMTLQDFTSRDSWLAEDLPHPAGKNRANYGLTSLPGHVYALCVMSEVIEIQAALISLSFHDIAQLLHEARFSVGGQAHHLVFVAVVRKTEELRKRGVEKA